MRVPPRRVTKEVKLRAQPYLMLPNANAKTSKTTVPLGPVRHARDDHSVWKTPQTKAVPLRHPKTQRLSSAAFLYPDAVWVKMGVQWGGIGGWGAYNVPP